MIYRHARTEGGIAFIPLTQGYEAIIDIADIHLVNDFNWMARVRRRPNGSIRTVYAYRQSRNVSGVVCNVYLHRVICGTPEGLETDHIDGDGLNNRRANLRAASVEQNRHNQRLSSKNTSGFKGVTENKAAGKWQAQICAHGRNRYLGLYGTCQEAAAAYAAASEKLHGPFGRLA